MLAVARKSDCCRVLGPGSRAVIWFYGCSKNCEGCIAKTMNNSGIFNEYTPKELYEWVKALKDIEGISISGGEPLEQDLKELMDFLGMVKNDDRKLSIILFTGYTYKEIFDCPIKNCILKYVDVLIDGVYKQELNDDKGLRGSSNQQIHFLTNKYNTVKELFFEENSRNLEFDITLDNDILINGIPKKDFIKELENSLRQEGFELV